VCCAFGGDQGGIRGRRPPAGPTLDRASSIPSEARNTCKILKSTLAGCRKIVSQCIPGPRSASLPSGSTSSERGLEQPLGQRCRRESGLSGGTAQNQPDRRFLSAVSAGTRFSWRGWRYRRRRSRSASGPESAASSDQGIALRGCRSRCTAPPSEVHPPGTLVAVKVCDAKLPSPSL
jgi:hypothetical protein